MLQAKVHPAFKRIKTVTGHPVVTKGQEVSFFIRDIASVFSLG